MASSSLLQVFLFFSLIVSGNCIAGTNELESLRQGGDGHLASYLMLRFLSDLETDMQELKAEVDLKSEVDDTQELKADIQELKAEVANTQELKADMQQLKANTADDRRYIEELKAEIVELKSKNEGMW